MTDVELSGRIPLVRHTSLIVRLMILIKATFSLLTQDTRRTPLGVDDPRHVPLYDH